MRRAPNLVSWWAGTAPGAASSSPPFAPRNVKGGNKPFPPGEQIVPPLDLQSLTKAPPVASAARPVRWGTAALPSESGFRPARALFDACRPREGRVGPGGIAAMRSGRARHSSDLAQAAPRERSRKTSARLRVNRAREKPPDLDPGAGWHHTGKGAKESGGSRPGEGRSETEGGTEHVTTKLSRQQ